MRYRYILPHTNRNRNGRFVLYDLILILQPRVVLRHFVLVINEFGLGCKVFY